MNGRVMRMPAQDRDSRHAAARLRTAMVLLFKIRDEVDPDRFTLAEIKQEFGAAAAAGIGGGVVFKHAECLECLVSAGYLERLDTNVYRITIAGAEVIVEDYV